MKELEQKADLLWMQHHRANMAESKENIYKHAIQSVNHTIETLEKKLKILKVNRVEIDWVIWHIQGILDEQIELKKILEGRL